MERPEVSAYLSLATGAGLNLRIFLRKNISTAPSGYGHAVRRQLGFYAGSARVLVLPGASNARSAASTNASCQ